MPTICFVAHDGTEHSVTVDNGISLMEAAVDNDVPGIDGDCGGACACATCHVMLDQAWFDKLGARDATEESMLSLAANVTDTSRLACQIDVSDALDGIKVQMPESQF
ncbi:MAG: 2Fe-2S iron-sulfur cluster-binding protein [Pseudomonadales bacterium]